MNDSSLDHPCFTPSSYFDPFQVSSPLSHDNGTLFHLTTEIAIVQRKRIGIKVHLRKPKKRKPKKPFVRRKLHYHLVVRCRRRRSNRPRRIIGPSRRDQQRTCSEKRRRYREGRAAREWQLSAHERTAYYEQVLTEPTQPLFQLHEFDKVLLAPFVDDLDPT